MLRAVLLVLLIVVVEIFIYLIMLGSWIVEGRRRAEELARLEAILEASNARDR